MKNQQMKNPQKRFRKIILSLAGALLLLVVFSLSVSPFFPAALQAGEMEKAPELTAAPLLQRQGEPPAGAFEEEGTLLRGLQVQVEVINQGRDPARSISLEIPLLAALDSPYQVLLEETFSHQPAALNLQAFNSRTMTLELPALGPGQSEIIVMDYALAAHIGNDGASLLEAPFPGDFLQPAPKVESDHPSISSRAAQITAGSTGEAEKVAQIYAFVVAHMDYNDSSPHRNTGALAALRYGEGVCEDYAALFAALCRAAGIPARVVYGYTDPTGTGEIFQLAPGDTLSLRGYRHAWVEFYLEDEGWLPADPTFENGSSTFRYFGNLPFGDRIAQNYQDQSIRGSYRGGQLSISWDEQLISH